MGLALSLLSAPSYACSWAWPMGMVSDWVDDKVVFWGRPLRSDEHGYTYFEVMRPLKDDLPSELKVRTRASDLSYISSCDPRFEMGKVDIYSASKNVNYEHYFMSGYHQESVGGYALTAYLDNHTDVKLDEWYKSRTWPIADYDPCALTNVRTEGTPYFCKWRDIFNEAKGAYDAEKKELEKDIKE